MSYPRTLLNALPNVVERHITELYSTLSRNVPKAREMLRKLITEIRLTPVDLGTASAYLEAEVVGNINGLLTLEPAYADTIGSGGLQTALYSWPLVTWAAA